MTITTRCQLTTCGKRFTLPASRLISGRPDDYCGKDCARAAHPEWFCLACDRPTTSGARSHNLPICWPCEHLAYRSCWRKRHFRTSFDAQQWIRVYEAVGKLSRPLTPYLCTLCERWHNSSWDPWERGNDEYRDRIAALAALFLELGFDIDEVRGWTNNPDGTHELRNDDFRVPDDILRAVEVIEQTREARPRSRRGEHV